MILPTVKYSDFYEGKIPQYKDLVKDIPSDVIIRKMCAINHRLSFCKDSKETFYAQSEILKEVFYKIGTYISRKMIDGKRFIIFSHKYTLELIQKELKKHRKIAYEEKELSRQQQKNLFKAYLLIIEDVNSKIRTHYGNEKLPWTELYRNYNWRLRINQIDLSKTKQLNYELLRGIALFKFLSENEKTKEAMEIFLKKTNKKNGSDYIRSIEKVLKTITDTSFKYPLLEYHKDFLNNFCVDPNDFERQKDFVALRAKPLFKVRPNLYAVINWNFLVDKLYTGLLFDFYKKSEIKSFPKFINFKSFLGKDFSEKFLIAPILDKCLGQNKHAVKFSDYNDKEGYPDFYYREGKYLFLFEIKDNLMSKEIIDSHNYEQLIKNIERNFIKSKSKGKKQLKGISQIFNQLKDLNENCYPEDNFVEKRIKTRNLVVYPIIIYTDSRYQLPTLDQYLNEKLEEKINSHNLEAEKEDDKLKFKVKPLTLINAEWFYDHYTYLKDNSTSFKKMIDDYQKHIKKRTERLEKTHSFEYFQQEMGITFERYTLRKLKDSFNQRGILDIMKDLGWE